MKIVQRRRPTPSQACSPSNLVHPDVVNDVLDADVVEVRVLCSRWENPRQQCVADLYYHRRAWKKVMGNQTKSGRQTREHGRLGSVSKHRAIFQLPRNSHHTDDTNTCDRNCQISSRVKRRSGPVASMVWRCPEIQDHSLLLCHYLLHLYV